MPVPRARIARGALAGATAATVWGLQQPLDQRLFGVRYDDCELLGTAVTGGRAAVPLGWALHALNGAAFGAAYAATADRLPLPPAVRGAAAALAEHVVTWPLARLLPRVHPRAETLPALWGDHRAFAQGAWRHALFGTLLGELDRRMSPTPEPAPGPPTEEVAATNGHGNLEHAVVGIVQPR
jgi:hypothetical protein